MLILMLAFICGFVMDVIWASCVSAVTRRQPALAAHLSVGLYLCALFSTVLIVENQWLSIVAFVVGNWLGTYCTIRWWTK